ncbi:PH domain-containing protein [Merdimonas faecis]|uniref:PH domain-containing protein n=1 Tax=Merdimonas faecis TaxID=1653435 RepID=UPI0032083578
MNYEKLSRQALKCMYVATAAGSILTLAILGAVNYFIFFPKDLDITKSASLAAALLILINMLVSPYFRYHRYRYRIDKECIDIHEGYLFTKRNIVPIERLHKLQTTKGPIDQFFGVSTVVVTTAGGDVAIRLLDEKKAEEIADSLRHRINQIVTEQRSDYGNTY